MWKVQAVVVRRIVPRAVPAIPHAKSVPYLDIDAVHADECGVHLGVAVMLAALAITNIEQPALVHLGHDEVVDRRPAGCPVGIRLERIIHLIKGIGDLLPPPVHDARRRPGTQIRHGIGCFEIEFNDCAVLLGGNGCPK